MLGNDSFVLLALLFHSLLLDYCAFEFAGECYGMLGWVGLTNEVTGAYDEPLAATLTLNPKP